MSRATVLLMATLLAGGCGVTKKCRPNSVYLTAELDSASMAATSLRVSLSVGGAPSQSGSIAHTPGQGALVVEVTFASGYPAGSAITVDIDALDGAQLLGSGHLADSLATGCTALTVAVRGGSDDAGTSPDLSLGDMRAVSSADLAGDGASPAAPDMAGECLISGAVYAAGAVNPGNACELCQPSTTSTAWSDAAGTNCGSGGVCNAGLCVSGCYVGGTLYTANEANPNNACQTCQTGQSTTMWSSVSDGTSCGNGQLCASGTCGAQCDIAGSIYPSNGVNPNNSCQSCQPGSSTSSWSNLVAGTSCSAGEVCNGGTCASGCFIAGVVYAANAANPVNSCQTCQPATSTTAWTATATDGTVCGGGDVCQGGSCISGCYIASKVYTAGTVDTVNSCLSCQPSPSPFAWATVEEGTSCNTGQVCNGSTCTAGCFISGAFYASNASNTADTCQTCQPGSSTTAWSNLAIGASCGTSKVCNNSLACASGCFIAGTFYASGAINPANSCQSCQPSASTTAWKNLGDGTTCAPGDVCSAGTCKTGVLLSYTGAAQSFIVPTGITLLNITATGGDGEWAGAVGGAGGIVKATIPVTPGESLAVYVGGGGNGINGGFNGGANGGLYNSESGTGGGGASDVRRGGSALGNRVVVAGGGGGCGDDEGNGGAGGGLSGANGQGWAEEGSGGGGGTQTMGGALGTDVSGICNPSPNGCTLTTAAGVGALGAGGVGAVTNQGGGGGGGGGFYGGAGGENWASGGGGGSGYAEASATNVTMSTASGFGSGRNGSVLITY